MKEFFQRWMLLFFSLVAAVSSFSQAVSYRQAATNKSLPEPNLRAPDKDKSSLNTLGLYFDIHLPIHLPYDYYYEQYNLWGQLYDEKLTFKTGFGIGFYLGWGFTRWLTLMGGFDFAMHPKPDNYWTSASTDYIRVGLKTTLPIHNSKLAPYATLEWGSRSIDMSRSTRTGNLVTIYDEWYVWKNSIHWGFGMVAGYFDLGFKTTNAGFNNPKSDPFPTYLLTFGSSGWLRFK